MTKYHPLDALTFMRRDMQMSVLRERFNDHSDWQGIDIFTQ